MKELLFNLLNNKMIMIGVKKQKKMNSRGNRIKNLRNSKDFKKKI